MAANLITTKLVVPRLSQSVVERPRLQEQLEIGPHTKLVLVSAPAGSGKTTLLAGWLKSLDRPTAWLSLDESDNDLERFLLYVVSAVQQIEPRLGQGLLEQLQTQSSVEVEPLMIRLINDIAGSNQDLLLVLDDYHLITNERIHHTVEFLLDHMPPGLCLVMATRTDPPLALARLRVRRHLKEVRAEDLRFSSQEANAFLNERLGLKLSSQAISSLEARTEGWAAGLQLAALSLGGRKDKEQFVQEFAGSHHYLVDYLMDEVLDGQTPEVQQFLERTSILDRFTAPLCEAVTQQPDAQDLLRKLDLANLFLIPLDFDRKWYRYHHLFAEFLRHRLAEAEGKRVPELHLNASQWFEQAGWSDEAIHHALLGNDLQRAGSLVEKMAFGLGVSWNNAQLIKYVERLPLELLPHFPRLCIYYGWALINTGRVEALARLLPVMEAANQQSPILRVCIVTARAYQQVWQMNFAAAVELCQEALSLLEELGAEGDEERWLRVASTNLVAYSYLLSDLLQADGHYPEARNLSIKLGNFVGSANGFARHGWVKHQLGKSHQAFQIFQEGLKALESWRVEGGRVVNVGELHLNLARVLYEWNRLDEVEHHLQKTSEFNQHSQFPPVLALEYELAFYLHLARGKTDAALAMMTRLDSMVNDIHPSNHLYDHLLGPMALRMRLHLAETQPGFSYVLDEVQEWVDDHMLTPSNPFNYAHEAGYFVLARLLLVQQPAEALPLLERLIGAAEADGRIRHLISYLVYQALANHKQNREFHAMVALHRALELAEPEGYCRSFVDHGASLRRLLEKMGASGQDSPYVRKLLEAFPSEASAAALEQVDGREATGVSLSVSLVERELEVLRLLEGGHSSKEIARLLDLSPNTVRWYANNLLAKLAASSRLEAVTRAKELKLI